METTLVLNHIALMADVEAAAERLSTSQTADGNETLSAPESLSTDGHWI